MFPRSDWQVIQPSEGCIQTPPLVSSGPMCAEWILRIAEKQDTLINLNYFMDFPEPFELKIKNTGAVCRNSKELYRNSIHFVR